MAIARIVLDRADFRSKADGYHLDMWDDLIDELIKKGFKNISRKTTSIDITITGAQNA